MFNCSEAYKIGCLGITDMDWMHLGNACLKGADFNVAKKIFARLNRIDIVNLIKTNEVRQIILKMFVVVVLS